MVATREQAQEPAIADAVVDVASAARRLVEERLALLRLEVRKDAKRILQAGALGAGGITAIVAAVGLAAAAIAATLALWMPVGPALGITAVVCAAAGVAMSVAARKRLPSATSGDSRAEGRELEARELGGGRALAGNGRASPERSRALPEQPHGGRS